MSEEKKFLELYEEISRIRQLLEILARDKLKSEIEKIATTDTRRKSWNLFNGKLSTSDIANIVKVTPRAVQMFVKDLQEWDLIEIKRRGYPKRKFEYLFQEKKR